MPAPMHAPFIPNWADLSPFLAELWLIATIVAVLLTPFFVRRPNSACGLVTLLGLGVALVSLIAVGSHGLPAASAATSAATANRFGPMLVADGAAFLWKVLLLLFVMGIVLMWFAATAHSMHEGDGPEFFTLLLGATLGMAVMASAANLLMVFMAVEAASLPSYVLAGFRKTHRPGAEASLKYVLFGAAAAAMMAYGLSLLYGLYGTLQLYPSPGSPGSPGEPGLARDLVGGLASGAPSALLVVAVFGLLCGLGFKIAAVPFHFWCPDVFEGAGIDVTAFLSVASKGAGLVLLLRVTVAVADAAGYRATGTTTAIASVIAAMGAVTCTLGNTAAFVQTNVKRLLAYSSIAHAGYMLCAVSLLVRHRPDFASPGDSATQAVLLYLAVYLFMNLGAFTVAAVVARQADRPAGAGRAGGGAGEDLSAFAGLGSRSPLLAACMTAFLFSLIGLPPLAGFTAKFYVLAVLVSNGGWWWVLVAVVGVNTVLSVYYYARILKVMYLERSDAAEAAGAAEGEGSRDAADAIAVDAVVPAPRAGLLLGRALSLACAVVLVLLFVGSNPLTRLTARYGRFQGVGTAPPVAEKGPSPAPFAAAR